MMRHSRLKSTTIYYNPTPEDELQTRTEAQMSFINDAGVKERNNIS